MSRDPIHRQLLSLKKWVVLVLPAGDVGTHEDHGITPLISAAYPRPFT
jgi:hypothetical protein